MAGTVLLAVYGRTGKLARLKIPNPKKKAQVAATGVFTAATFGHQGQGISPKRMKVLRAIAGGHYGKLSFGSLDLVFDLSWVGSGDPMCKIVLEHWNMLQECVARNLPSASLVQRTWAVSWQKLSRSPHRWKNATGPIGAMQCYLMDMGFDAPSMDVWKKEGTTINLAWGSPRVGVEVKERLHQAMIKDRWNRINSQEDADGTAGGIDWTVPRRMLRESIKHPLQHSGLRMLFQGAIRRANHGGDDVCARCGQANTLRHVLHDCIRWAEVDIGPDPAWRDLYPQAPVCEVWHDYELFLTCQDRVVLAAELLSARGETWAFKFLAYVGCLLTWLAAKGLSLKDTGTTNIGVTKETASQQLPRATFFDTMSWTIVARPTFRWSGWLECATKFCPAHSQWLRQAVLGAAANPALAFSKLLVECQAYSDILESQGALLGGVMAEPTALKLD